MMTKETLEFLFDYKMNNYEYATLSALLTKENKLIVPTFGNNKKAKKQLSDIIFAKKLLNL